MPIHILPKQQAPLLPPPFRLGKRNVRLSKWRRHTYRECGWCQDSGSAPPFFDPLKAKALRQLFVFGGLESIFCFLPAGRSLAAAATSSHATTTLTRITTNMHGSHDKPLPAADQKEAVLSVRERQCGTCLDCIARAERFPCRVLDSRRCDLHRR